MTQPTRTFGHYPLDPNFVKVYTERDYMSQYLD